MLGGIFYSTQILVTHLVMTFSVIITTFLEYTWRMVQRNKMSMLSLAIFRVCDDISGQTERKNMLILMLGTTPIPPMTIVMIIDRKCRDQVTN